MRAWLALALLLPLLAGCTGSGSTSSTSVAAASSSGALQDHTAQAPAWKVGQSWDHRFYLGQNDTKGVLATVVVARDQGASWLLATPSNLTAALHAAFYFPDLGTFTKADLAGSDGGRSFPWYHFPLSDGKTWTANEKNVGFDLKPVSYDVSCAAKLVPGAAGQPDRFTVTCTTGGKLRSIYDYDPTVGWFTEFRSYDTSAAHTPDQWQVRIAQEALRFNAQGTVYSDKADFIANIQSVFAPGAVPSPANSFTMTADHTFLLGFLLSFASDGVQNTELYDPMLRRVTGYQAFNSPVNSFADGPDILFTPGVAGDWHVLSYGAGAVAGGLFLGWGIHQETLTIGK
jgi:hypothetical protein